MSATFQPKALLSNLKGLLSELEAELISLSETPSIPEKVSIGYLVKDFFLSPVNRLSIKVKKEKNAKKAYFRFEPRLLQLHKQVIDQKNVFLCKKDNLQGSYLKILTEIDKKSPDLDLGLRFEEIESDINSFSNHKQASESAAEKDGLFYWTAQLHILRFNLLNCISMAEKIKALEDDINTILNHAITTTNQAA